MKSWEIVFLVLSVLSPAAYVYRTLKGTVRPHRITRLVIAFASVANILAVWGDAGTMGRLFATVFLVRALGVFVLSVFRGRGGTSRLDIVCLVIAIAAVISGYAQSGLLAVILAMTADLIGYVPAYIKTFKDPVSEEPLFYGIEIIASSVVLLGIGKLGIESILPIFFIATSALMLAIMYLPLPGRANPWPKDA